ncbi:MAG: dienelactone hydrolase family protein [Actinomycetota bacterium]
MADQEIMDPNVRYLAEEIAENHADGLLSRREAMRRLGYLGVTVMGASALLAACGGGGGEGAADDPTAPATETTSADSPTPGGGQTAPAAPPTTGAPLPVEDITYPGRGTTLLGVFAAAASPKGAVLVIHENQGVTPFVRSMVGRLAGSGYSALAVDLLSAQGGTATFTDPATIGPALTANATDRSVDDMKSSLTELARRTPGAKLAAIGFCFGGGMVWELLKAGGSPELAAAIPFYGQANNPDFARTDAAVLAVYAENDARVNANQPVVKAALESASVTHEVRTFPGVNHAFVRSIDDPTAGPAHTQAQAAFGAMLAWFDRHLR